MNKPTITHRTTIGTKVKDVKGVVYTIIYSGSKTFLSVSSTGKFKLYDWIQVDLDYWLV
jgi:hypothetical protein